MQSEDEQSVNVNEKRKEHKNNKNNSSNEIHEINIKSAGETSLRLDSALGVR